MRKKLLSGFLIAGMLLSPMTFMEVDAQGSSIVIYHTNDTHGYMGSGNVPLSKVATLKAETPNSILVDAGDATQGLPMASMTKGEDIMSLMNMAGYDLMTVGNHEFDFGIDQLMANVRAAKFPVLAANVTKDGTPLLKDVQPQGNGCHTVVERDGKKIGFFGLVTTQTKTATNSEGIKGIEFQDEVETAKKEIKELEAEDVDAIIAVAHIGDADAPCTSEDLANALTGEYQNKLTAIIDGHSHTEENKEVNDVEIVQTGYGLNAVGELTLNFDGEEVSTSERLLKEEDVKDVVANKDVEAKLQAIDEAQTEITKQVIGTTPTTLWAGWVGDSNIAMTRMVETNYGDLACDAFIQAGKNMVQNNGNEEDKAMPIVAVENGGGIREALSNGTITKGNLIATFPFSNTLYMKKVTPSILYQMMEISASSMESQDLETGFIKQSASGGFLQIGGFQVTFDPNGEAGQKVAAIRLDGQETVLDKNDTTTQVLLISNNFIMTGGNEALKDLPKYGEAGGELETIQSYIESNLKDGILQNYTTTQNRMQYVGYEAKDYIVSIHITDENGKAVVNKKMSYRVDGGKRINGTTNDQGILEIKVSDGAHGILLADSQKEVYVDNYLGLGVKENKAEGIVFPTLTYIEGQCDPIVEETTDDKEEEKQEEIPDKKDETTPVKPSKNDSEHPNTGDTTNTGMWAFYLLLGAGVALKAGYEQLKEK